MSILNLMVPQGLPLNAFVMTEAQKSAPHCQACWKQGHRFRILVVGICLLYLSWLKSANRNTAVLSLPNLSDHNPYVDPEIEPENPTSDKQKTDQVQRKYVHILYGTKAASSWILKWENPRWVILLCDQWDRFLNHSHISWEGIISPLAHRSYQTRLSCM